MIPPENEPLRFVPIGVEHLRAVMEIEREAYPEPWTENMFRQEVDSAMSYFYVAYLGEVLIGYVGFWLVADEAHITSVTVHKDYRQRGFGRAEVRFILSVAAIAGVRLATLEVRVSNLRAQSLYAQMGFRKIGHRKNYYAATHEDAIVMARDVTPEDAPLSLDPAHEAK